MNNALPGLLKALLLASASMACIATAHASDARTRAENAVAGILFEYDGADEFTSYRVNGSGFVDISFAANMPDELYISIVEQMRADPDIDGVLGGKTGPSCSLFQ